jgi:hypothetical protein
MRLLSPFMLLLTLSATTLSCSEMDSNQSSEVTSQPATDNEQPSDPGLEEDIKQCFAKAIAIADGIDLDRRFETGERLSLMPDLNGTRLQSILRKISARSNGFDPGSFPRKITLNYDECMFSELEWELSYLGNRTYSIKFEYCVDGDFSPKGGFIAEFNPAQDQYKTDFDVWQLTENEEGAMETTTKITIKNDEVTRYDREKKPLF